jgi:hypothetical protein
LLQTLDFRRRSERMRRPDSRASLEAAERAASRSASYTPFSRRVGIMSTLRIVKESSIHSTRTLWLRIMRSRPHASDLA